jgi:hypothetical protein
MNAPRYSLRSIFVLTLGVAMFAAICRVLDWEPEAIVLAALTSSAITLLGWGMIARKQKKLLLMSGGIAFLGAFFFALMASQVAVGHGSKSLPVRIDVYDADTQRPVSGARVWLDYGEGPETPPISTVEQTDSTGRAQIVAELAIGTRDSLFTDRTTVAIGHYVLHVEAPGYKASDVLSRHYWPSGIDYRNLPIPPAKVYLERLEKTVD